jgi:hypothetical protein
MTSVEKTFVEFARRQIAGRKEDIGKAAVWKVAIDEKAVFKINIFISKLDEIPVFYNAAVFEVHITKARVFFVAFVDTWKKILLMKFLDGDIWLLDKHSGSF